MDHKLNLTIPISTSVFTEFDDKTIDYVTKTIIDGINRCTGLRVINQEALKVSISPLREEDNQR